MHRDPPTGTQLTSHWWWGLVRVSYSNNFSLQYNLHGGERNWSDLLSSLFLSGVGWGGVRRPPLLMGACMEGKSSNPLLVSKNVNKQRGKVVSPSQLQVWVGAGGKEVGREMHNLSISSSMFSFFPHGTSKAVCQAVPPTALYSSMNSRFSSHLVRWAWH